MRKDQLRDQDVDGRIMPEKLNEYGGFYGFSVQKNLVSYWPAELLSTSQKNVLLGAVWKCTTKPKLQVHIYL